MGIDQDETHVLIVFTNFSKNGPYRSALQVLLSIDLVFTFPIVFTSGRQILEDAFLLPGVVVEQPQYNNDDDNNDNNNNNDTSEIECSGGTATIQYHSHQKLS